MIDGGPNSSAVSLSLTIRDLRRDRNFAPGGGRFPEVIRRFLPLVFGISSALVPENPEAAERVSAAVFETLAFRWRRLSRKTPVASWLVRTTTYAVATERSRLDLKAKPEMPGGVLAHKLFREWRKLPTHCANAFVLCAMLGEQPSQVAMALRTNARRVEKRHIKAVAKLTRQVNKALARLRKMGPIEATPFRSYTTSAPEEVEARILERVGLWAPKAKKDPLVSSSIAAWRWLAVGRFFKRVVATIGATVCVLITLAFTTKFLVDHGHVNMMLLFSGRMQKELLEEFPGMKQKAKPWPAKPEEMALASRKMPSTAADIYGTTNIWVAKIKFSQAQWKAAQPLTIPPAPQLPNGKMPLRNPKASRSGLAGAIGIDFPWSEASFEFGVAHFDKVGVRFRGNGTYLNSLYGDKQSYKVDLNRAKKGQQIAGVTTFNFVNSIPDFSYLKDALAQKLFRELGAVAPRTAYAYLTVDGPPKLQNQPLGLFVLIEDVGAIFAKDRFGTKDAPIFKPVTYDLFDDWGKDWSAYRDIYDLKTKATKEQLARVVEFAQLVSHASDEEFAQKLPEFLDLKEYAAFVAGHVLTSSYDGYLSNGQNFYMYLDPRSNKFGFIPWDQDHGWGEFGYVDTTENRENASIWKPAAYNNRFLARVMKVEAFRKVYRAKLEEGLAGPFTVERLSREIDALAAVVRPAVAAESDFRLERFEIAISTNWVSGSRNAGRDWRSSEGPRAPSHQLKRFILARTQSVRDQLDGKSEGVLIRGFGD